jgi:hypothetical protein
MPVKLNSTGGGSVTLTTPSTASDFTVTIPAATGTMVTTTSASTIEFAAGSAAAPSVTTTGDTNTGIFFPAADTIAFSEGGAEVMRIDSSGNLQFNSGYGSVATAYGCRAWVNFNGTGTVAIRASGNVTSITDNGTGEYTVNLTTALTDANYSVVGSCGTGAAGNDDFNLTTNFNAAPTTSAVRIGSQRANTGVLTDVAYISLAIFR